MEEELLPL